MRRGQVLEVDGEKAVVQVILFYVLQLWLVVRVRLCAVL